MYYCYGKGVQKSVLCREVVTFSEGHLLEVPLYIHQYVLCWEVCPLWSVLYGRFHCLVVQGCYDFHVVVWQLHMSSATEESNEKHLTPWSEACSRDSISNTPLSPYLDQELLYHKHLHIDGSKIEQTGFSYEHARPTVDLLRQVSIPSTTIHTISPCGYFRWWTIM